MKRSLSLFAAALISSTPFIARAQQKAEEAPAAPAPAPAPAPTPLVTITPYGFILVNGYFNAGAFANNDFGFKATPGGAGQFLGNARQSRFGLRIGMPDALGAKLKAVLEMDFQGGFAAGLPATVSNANATTTLATNTEWYRPDPRLRLAYGTATWATPVGPVTFEAGADYGLVAPLFATSVAYVANPVFWGAGNLWTRTPQVRISGELGKEVFGEALGLTYAVAALDPLSPGLGDPVAGPGTRSRMPALEARVALLFKANNKTVFEAGASGHYSKERFQVAATPVTNAAANDQDVTRWITAGDLQLSIPFSLPGNTQPLVAFKGEAFAGEELNMYFSNTFFPTVIGTTAANGNTASPQNFKAVYEQGMWGQLTISPLDAIQLVAGAGIEQPKYSDLVYTSGSLNGFAAGGTTQILGKNVQLHGGLILNASKNWKCSFEVLDTRSTYVQTVAVAAVAATPANPATADPGKPAAKAQAAGPTTTIEHQQYSFNTQFSF